MSTVNERAARRWEAKRESLDRMSWDDIQAKLGDLATKSRNASVERWTWVDLYKEIR